LPELEKKVGHDHWNPRRCRRWGKEGVGVGFKKKVMSLGAMDDRDVVCAERVDPARAKKNHL